MVNHPNRRKVVDFDGARVAPYLIRAIEGFLSDPPDTEHQRGYLAALIAVYLEGIGRGATDARILAGQKLLERE